MATLPKPHHRRIYYLITVVVLAFLLGLWAWHNSQLRAFKPTLRTATIFTQPRAITPFQLTDDEGQPFTLENLKGHYTLIFFGFTHCPDLCPTTLSTLNQAYQKLQNVHLKNLPQVLFISVDPEQDTPAVIKTYLSSFNSAFLGATGSREALDKLMQEMSVLYAKILQTDDPAHYTIDHSGTLIIVNPKGQFYGVFTAPQDAQKITDDMQALLKTTP